MEKSTLFYLKSSIAALITLIVVMFMFLNLFDYFSSTVVEAIYFEGEIVHQETNNTTKANNYQQKIFADGDKVKVLYNEDNDILIFYGSFYEYFKRIIIGFVIIFTAWFFAFIGGKERDEEE
jgi:hypothetical protein